MTPLCDLEPDCLSVSLRGAVGSYFVGCVPRRTESEMPLAHSFTVRACGCVCGDCVKVLPHCLLSLSVSSPWASVFSSQLCSSLTTCLQPSAKAPRPWITTAVVIVFARGVVKACGRGGMECTPGFSCVYGFASSCAFFFFLLLHFAPRVLIWEQACSLGLRGGVLSADFVRFKARGSLGSIVSGTHRVCAQLIGCAHGRQPQLKSGKSYVNTLVTSFEVWLDTPLIN